MFVNREKIDSPHRPALDALATHLSLRPAHFGDALEDPSFLAMLAALVNSGYWFFQAWVDTLPGGAALTGPTTASTTPCPVALRLPGLQTGINPHPARWHCAYRADKRHQPIPRPVALRLLGRQMASVP
ncbi:hypothetical protein MPTA6580_7320 [Mycoplasmoides pneumoniae]